MTSRSIVSCVRATALVLIGLASVFSLAAAPTASDTSPAPDFVLKARTGKNLRLSERRGEVVMINFWATWCVGCRDEMPRLDELFKRYQAAGFTVLGVNVDEKRIDAETMLKNMGVTFPILYDVPASDGGSDFSKFRVAKLYQVRKMPITFLVDRNGRLRYIHGGYSRGDEQEYERKIRELLKE